MALVAKVVSKVGSMPRIRFRHLWTLIAGLVMTSSAIAHDFSVTDVVVRFNEDRTYRVDMICDVDALALGLPPSADSRAAYKRLAEMTDEERQVYIDHAKDTLLRRVRIRFDRGEKELPDVTFPFPGQQVPGIDDPSFLGLTARFEDKIPEGAKTFTFGASRSFMSVRLVILDAIGGGEARHVLAPSERSPAYTIGAPPANQDSDGWTAGTFWRYLVLGFEHILPAGVDHILFVLGLFLLSLKLKPLLWQITAFTVAHSVTLALSIYDVVSLPSRPVETLIALSICYVAVENLLTRELKPWRPAVVFAFGLLHGLGFAGVLRELGLPENQFAEALIAFNVGVELGQVAVVLIALLLVGWFRRKRWYRAAIVIPGSSIIALIGLYWTIERGFLGG